MKTYLLKPMVVVCLCLLTASFTCLLYTSDAADEL